MNVYVTARRMPLTDAMRDHVERHLVSQVARHAGREAVRLEVQLYAESARRARFGCHVTLELPRHRVINIRERGADLYVAIDLTQKRLLHALTEHQHRRLTESRRPKKYSFDRLMRALGLRREPATEEGSGAGS